MVVERIALPAATGSAQRGESSNQPDGVLIATLVTLLFFGTLVQFSASYAAGIRDDLGGLYYLKRQLVAACFGIVALVVGATVDYRTWRRISVPAMAVTLILLLLVVLPIGHTAYGARRWFNLGPIQVQPSEIMKFATRERRSSDSGRNSPRRARS